MTNKTTIKIGTRGSKLALAQANMVSDLLLKFHPNIETEIVIIQTTGDKILEKNLNEIGGKGLFIKEIEEHLAEGKIDIAVHSMKDMPALIHDTFEIPCILKREDPRDAFLSNKCSNISDLPQGATVGTSSPRRSAQLLNIRPDLNIIPFRGNIHTRLEKLSNNIADATLLAMAGLIRCNINSDNIFPIDEDELLPAVAQGAIGVEIRKEDVEIKKLLAPLNHFETYTCVMAERVFLEAFEGSCKTPIGALAKINGTNISIKFMIASIDGKIIRRSLRKGKIADSKALAVDAASELKTKSGEGFFG
jgi:hydroxymethylbilane synthase